MDTILVNMSPITLSVGDLAVATVITIAIVLTSFIFNRDED